MIQSRAASIIAAVALLAWAAACGDWNTEPPTEAPNRAPLSIGTIPSRTMHVGDSVTLDVADYFTDPDGDTVSYTVGSSDPATATATAVGSSITLAAFNQGSATVTVTATDPGGLSATQTFDVTVPNRPPLAVDSIVGIELFRGDSVNVDVANYFTDPDGDSLSYGATSSDALVATASTEDGRVRLNALSQGLATITIIATDPGGLSATQTFEVTVPNRAPLAVDSIARLELFKGDTAILDVADYFTDPDGDTLSYTATTSDPETATAAADGSEITLAAITQGSATVTISATDPGGLSVHLDFNVIVERPPLLVTFATARATAPEGAAAMLEVVLSRPLETSVAVSYKLGPDDDPATEDADEADYAVGNRGVLDFAPGVTSATLQVAINDDPDIEPSREVLVATLDPPGPEDEYLLGSRASATVTIEEGVCDRTPEVGDEIMYRSGVLRCAQVDELMLARIDIVLICDWRHPSCEREHPLADLRSADFQGLSGLKVLDLDWQSLDSLPQGVFGGLSALEVLRITGNYLTSLPNDVFAGLSALQHLALGYNDLTSLPHDVFAGLSALQDLALDHNDLTELPPGIFLGLSAIEELDLSGNPGSPFALAIQLRRTDDPDLHAPSPGTVDAWVAEGAPFEIAAPLSADGGELSGDTVILLAGSANSAALTATRTADGRGGTLVSAGPVGGVPDASRESCWKPRRLSPFSLQSDRMWPWPPARQARRKDSRRQWKLCSTRRPPRPLP